MAYGNWAAPTISTGSAAAASASLVASNPDRAYCSIQNLHDGNIWLNFDGAAEVNKGIRLGYLDTIEVVPGVSDLLSWLRATIYAISEDGTPAAVAIINVTRPAGVEAPDDAPGVRITRYGSGGTAGGAAFVKVTDGTDLLDLQRADAAGAVGTITVPVKVVDTDGDAAGSPRVARVDAVDTAASKAMRVKPVDEAGAVLKGGSGGVGGGAGIYSVKQGDLTATYQSATILTLAGLPAGLSVGYFVQVNVWDSAGLLTIYKPDDTGGGFSYDDATGRLTVLNGAFDATDKDYDVLLWGVPKGFDAPNNQNIVQRTNPDWLQRDRWNVVTAVNVANGTYPYHVLMDGYTKAGFDLRLTGALSVKIYGTMDDPSGDLSTLNYTDITADVAGVAAITASDMVIDNAGVLGMYTVVKIEVTASGGGTDDYIIEAKKLYA